MGLYYPANAAENAALVKWCADRIPHVRGGDFGPCQALGVVRRGRMAAVVVFHDWQKAFLTLQVSMASETPAWASRDVLRGMFAYGFLTARANKLWTATPHDAAGVLAFNRGIGMKSEATLGEHFGPKRHAVICRMFRREWEKSRWAMEG
jgi:hypothetical protein